MKKQNKKYKLISTLLVVVMLFGFVVTPPVVGQSTDDLLAERDAKQRELNEILKRISGLQDEIQERKSLRSTLANEIAIINLEIAETEAQLEATAQEIDVLNFDIADVTEKIVQNEKDIANQKAVLKELIIQINDLDQRSPLEIALENDNFTDFLNQLQYVTSVQEASQEALSEIKILKAELIIKESELKQKKAGLDALQEQLTLAQAGLSGQRNAKQQIVNETRGQERIYQELLAESEGLEDEIAREIFELEVSIRTRLGDRRLPGQKGLLAWPMQGVLTQGYGNTGFTKLGYTFHNGIDIAAPAGTQIYAAGDGTVINTGTGEGAYGNWVTIRHNIPTADGNRALISLYAHMSSFRISVGQTVTRGELIGFEGNTGNTTRLLYGPHRGFHIHFTLFDAEGYGVAPGKFESVYGPYQVPYGATYNPLEFL
jgi:murein DD-endopeptidase MepM/ murein hydrolase activator NlpD